MRRFVRVIFLLFYCGVGVFAQQDSGKPSAEVLKYFQKGSKAFLEQKYSDAAVSYHKALDLEKKNRTLSQDLFRVLVDNLGMSYGIPGKLDQAKEIFEYGIAQDPQYPLFYYNLACTYGEQRKMDEAIAQLRLAFKYKDNMIKGETMPDPLKDDSFRYFVDDKEFVRVVHELQQQ